MALMSIADAIFFVPERREQPMHVGSLQVYQLPEDAGPDWVANLYASWLECTDVRTLFRRRPVRTLRTLGAWAWAVDDDIDLEHHVRLSALPRPGRVRELLALVSRLHGTPIDRQRPLWELHLIDGLEGGRFAVYTKVHHALLDGVTGVRLLADAMAGNPSEDVAPFWATRPGGNRSANAASASVPGTLLQAGIDLAELGPALARRVLEAALGADQHAVPPRTILNVAITGSRRYAAQGWPLDQVRAVARAGGGTVNDVVLAMCAAALRRYLSDLDALPDAPLVAMTPVSLRLRRREGADEGGNAVGAILCNLATDLADPAQRLAVIHSSMATGKASLAGLTPLQITALSAVQMAPLATSIFRPLVGLLPPPFNLIISNVPGPRHPRYLNGARLAGLYPLSVPIDGQALNVTVISYDGSLEFGLTGDRRALPHLQRLLGHLDTGLKDLALAVGA